MKLRFRLRLLVKWYLGHFEEVRILRKAESEHYRLVQELHQKLAVAMKDVNALDANGRELAQALQVMTEARLNADRHSDALQRTVTALSLSHETTVSSLKQTVDCFSLASMGRQVFGMAPSVTRQIDEMAQQPIQAGMQARNLVQEQTRVNFQEAMERRDAFLREAEAQMERMKQGQSPDGAQPEYSSTARAL